MKITGCQNGVTLLTHNGREYATDRDVGEVGDELTYNLHDGARWVNDKTGADVRETFIYSESESEFNALFDEFHGGVAE